MRKGPLNIPSLLQARTAQEIPSLQPPQLHGSQDKEGKDQTPLRAPEERLKSTIQPACLPPLP